MQNTHYLIALCQQLHQMGKTPSVALIRQHADRSLGIPEIVKALQSWKTSPKISMNENKPLKQSEDQRSLEERVKILEEQVAQLSAQFAAQHHTS